MWLRRLSVLFVVLAPAVFGISACNGDDDASPGSPTADAARLTGSKWLLVDVAGEPALPRPSATLEFPGPDDLGGNTSCNHFGGKFEVSGGGLEVGDLFQTLIGCEPAVAAQETRYMEALRSAERFAFDGDDLLIYSSKFDAPLRFEPSRAAAAPTAAPQPGGAWTSLPPLASGARQETAVVAFDGEIVVIGGFDGRGQVSNLVEAFSPATNSWRRLPDVPVAMHHANAATVGDALFVVGFLTGSNFAPDGRIYVLAKGATRWELSGTMPAGQERGSSGPAVIDGKVYLAGGLRNGSVTDFSSFDPSTGDWKDLPAVPQRRDHAAAGGIDGKFVLAGGRGGAITALTPRVDVFDPATNVWTAGAPMPTARAGTASAVLDGKLYVFGGEGNASDASGVFPEAEAYDLATDSWSTLTPMKTPRHGTGAATLGDRIYMPGGATRQAFGAVDTVDDFAPPD